MSVGAWIATQPPVYTGMHKQPGRLVRAGLRSPFGPSADRLTSLEGLGTLGWSWPWENDESLGTDEEAEAEGDSAWAKLVSDLVKAASPVAVEIAKGEYQKSKLSEGWSGDMIAKYLGLADARAAAVQSGTASMPTAGWIGIGVGAVAILGLVLVLALRK